MKLLSATVRNYRIHLETRVDFDGSRTLIGGPNEAGKSTFIEAVHRGLFLKSKISGAIQLGMVSNDHSGHPEVEIDFEVQGQEYRLVKQFSGSTGTTKLTKIRGDTLQADKAEARLNKLLQVEEVGVGRKIAGRIQQQWAHLWVWQGKSGNDPSDDASAEQSALLKRLQDSGGAGAMQSAYDDKVARHFSQLRDGLFTQAGRAKAGSELDTAQKSLSDAEQRRQAAETRFNQLDPARRSFGSASKAIELHTNLLDEFIRQRDAVLIELGKAGTLKSQEEQHASSAKHAEEAYSDAKMADSQIESLRGTLRELDGTNAPKKELYRRAMVDLEAARGRANEAAREHDASAGGARNKRLLADLARCWVELFDNEAKVQSLSKRLKEDQAIRGTVSADRQALAKLPQIDSQAVEQLRVLKSNRDQAEAALNAMAVGITVIASNQTVRVGNKEAAPGSTVTVSETTDVLVGENIKLRIHPGGEDRLAECREASRTATAKLAHELGRLGFATLEEAEKTLEQRIEITNNIERKEDQLSSGNGGTLEDDLAAAQVALVAVEVEVEERRSSQVVVPQQPSGRDEAVNWRADAKAGLVRAEESESEAQANNQVAKAKLEDCEKHVQALKVETDQEGETISELTHQLHALIGIHGDDELRQQALNNKDKARVQAQSLLAVTRNRLADLPQEQNERERDRLDRAIQIQKDKKQTAIDDRAESRAILVLDGSEDPQAEFIRAKAGEAADRQHVESVERKAKAVKLLHSLFEEQQAVLAGRFTGPLAEKITEYLQCMFGSAARAIVNTLDGALAGISFSRAEHSGAFDFDVLSGGTREQVAAAVRLAVAEVLAADHGGTLPVIFDDAFSFSDSSRVQHLQRMLDLAAVRGLQIVILTNNPSDYAGLGASEVIFPAKFA